MIKRFLKWASSIIIGIIIIIVIFSIRFIFQEKDNLDQVPSILGYKPMYILSQSMRPALEPGDIIFSRTVNPEDIKINDVITYRIRQNILVTHRVNNIVIEDGQMFFKTKGDANDTEDNTLISQNQLVGRLVFNIPKGGYITNFITNLKGFLLVLTVIIIGDKLKVKI